MVMPRPSEVRQIASSGQGQASDSGEIAMAPPIAAMNRIGRRGVNFSETNPPTISPTDSAAVIAPQAAAPPRCVAGHHRPEHLERPVPGHQDHAELSHDRPQPGVRAELGPAVAQVAQHAAVTGPLVRHHAQGAHQRHRAERAGAAGHQRPARPEDRDGEAGQHRAAHLAAVHGQPADRAGLLEQATGDQPGQQRLGRRVEDGHAGAGHDLQHDHLPQPGMAGQDQDAERALAQGDHEVARDDHQLRPDPVGDDPADQR